MAYLSIHFRAHLKYAISFCDVMGNSKEIGRDIREISEKMCVSIPEQKLKK